LCLIFPCVSFDSLATAGKPETNRLSALNGSRRLKAKTSLGNIQDDAAIVSVEIDIGKPFHRHPWSLSAFRPYHWRYSPCQLFGGLRAEAAASPAEDGQIGDR
jgi:hypothetical protein